MVYQVGFCSSKIFFLQVVQHFFCSLDLVFTCFWNVSGLFLKYYVLWDCLRIVVGLFLDWFRIGFGCLCLCFWCCCRCVGSVLIVFCCYKLSQVVLVCVSWFK